VVLATTVSAQKSSSQSGGPWSYNPASNVVSAPAGSRVTVGTPLPTTIGNAGVLVPVVVSTSGPVTVAATGFYVNNASGALTYRLPTVASGLVGMQFCFRNATARTGAITITAPALTYLDVNGTNGSVAGTLVSGGAAGDSACVVAISTTEYLAYPGNGSWTNN
jgi:hypothetical protein